MTHTEKYTNKVNKLLKERKLLGHSGKKTLDCFQTFLHLPASKHKTKHLQNLQGKIVTYTFYTQSNWFLGVRTTDKLCLNVQDLGNIVPGNPS